MSRENVLLTEVQFTVGVEDTHLDIVEAAADAIAGIAEELGQFPESMEHASSIRAMEDAAAFLADKARAAEPWPDPPGPDAE